MTPCAAWRASRRRGCGRRCRSRRRRSWRRCCARTTPTRPIAAAARDRLRDPGLRQRFPNFIERMMLLDTLTYLPDDLLTKVDRASMSVSLEVRVPLLNHRVVECAWRLPLAMKLRRGTTKWALRRILDRHVPRALIERPKQGFAVPLAAWLRGPLRGWADDLLAGDALGRSG